MKFSPCDDVGACMDMAKSVTSSAVMARTRAQTLRIHPSSIKAEESIQVDDVLPADQNDLLASNFALFMTTQALIVIAYVNHIVDEQ
jgi:hypothetical protein